MTLVLTLERSPHPQAVRQMRLESGQLVIGRSPEADWQIDDQDLLVSRTHCTISGRPGSFVVTDTSSGGLFLDDARMPLGQGNVAPLADGMRLRLGDYVVRVEIRAAEPLAPPPPPPIHVQQPPVHAQPLPVAPPPPPPPRPAVFHEAAPGFVGDDFFSRPVEIAPAPPRPAGLPDPFENPAPGAFSAAERAAVRPPPVFDDPFTLDSPPSQPVAPRPEPVAPEPAPMPRAAADPFADWTTAPSTPAATRPEPPAAPQPPQQQLAPVASEPPAPTPRAAPPPVRAVDEAALRAAFFRGLGLPDAPAGGRDPVAEMEALGRQYRMMVDGLMDLLRKRAEEKDNARVGRTRIGAQDVNPLKFMPTAETALSAMLTERTPGFLPAEQAIAGAVLDLARHHVDTWRGIQASLDRMIDRFSPAALEEELKSRSTVETLLAGGRRAKLWELYEQRFREIAKSAEDRFLGEVGADFRDAYEERGNGR